MKGDALNRLAEDAKDQVNYNAHDLGELGKFIRVSYAHGIVDDLALKIRMLEEQDQR